MEQLLQYACRAFSLSWVAQKRKPSRYDKTKNKNYHFVAIFQNQIDKSLQLRFCLKKMKRKHP